jgi:BirA family biotin operon repressor/biotin-[acetyl-CoA-carboxylase] ligase
MLGLLTGCAVIEAIRKLVNLDVKMKWPNDIVLGRKKLGGILSELVSGVKTLHGVVIGIGINQNNMLESNPELEPIATSIINEVGYETSPETLASFIISSIDSRIYDVDSMASFNIIRKEWLSLNTTIGTKVLVTTEHGQIRGTATGITETGSLVISTNSKILDITAGDIHHIR